MLTTLITVITTMIAVGGFLAGIYQYRRTVQLNTFRLYADKYNSIITPAILDKWTKALGGEDENWAELTPTMIAYLNLIWEEYYLSRNGIISKSLWRIWRPTVNRIINTGFARQVMTRYHYYFPPDLLGEIHDYANQ